MSKLFKNYVSLKVQDCTKFYLFKSGIFYIFLDEDARTMAPLLDLKLSNLNSTVVKCGFPTQSLDKYLLKIKNTEYEVHIVTDDDIISSVSIDSFINNKKLIKILNDFVNVNIDDLSISSAFDLLYDLQSKLERTINDGGTSETKK